LSIGFGLLHAFESSDLAAMYPERKHLLDGNPSHSQTQKDQTGPWRSDD